jgi:hypothetical protein
MTIRYFTVTNGPADPDEPGTRLFVDDTPVDLGSLTFTCFPTPAGPE